MICKNCGSPLEEGAKFCGNCGAVNDSVQNVSNTNPAVSNVQPSVDPALNNVQPSIDPALNNVQPSVEPALNNVQPSVEPVINTVEPTLENYSSDISGNSSSDDFSSEKKSKKGFILPIVLLLVLCSILGGLCYYFKNPKRIVTSVINGFYDKFESSYDSLNSYNYKTTSMLVNGDLKVSTTVPEMQDLNSIDLSYNVGLDYPNKKMEMGATYSEDGVALIDAMAYILNSEAFLSLKNDYPNLIKLNTDEVEFSEVFDIEESNISEEDLKYIVKAYKNILIDSFDSSDFKKSTEKIDLNGKTVKVDRVDYILNEKNIKKLSDRIIDGTLADSKLLEILSSASGVSVQELKSELESSKGNSSFSGGEKLVLSIYTKGFTNTLVGLDLSVGDTAEMKVRFNDSNTDIGIYSSSIKVASIIVKDVNDDTCSIDINVDAIGASANITVTNKQVEKDVIDGSINLTINYDGESFNIINNYTQKFGVDIASIDTSNYKSFDELTEEELNALSDLYTSRFEGSKIYALVNNLSELLSNSYDYDYDYDYDSAQQSSL